MAGSVERFEQVLRERGLVDRIVRLEQDTRTAELAARALGTEVGAIVKSLVLFADQRPVLALVSGDRRADLATAARLFGVGNVQMARGAAVKEITGFAIGGVPPLLTGGDGEPLPAIMDEQLFRYEETWAAAGSPYAVFPIRPAELERLTGSRVAAFTQPQ